MRSPGLRAVIPDTEPSASPSGTFVIPCPCHRLCKWEGCFVPVLCFINGPPLQLLKRLGHSETVQDDEKPLGSGTGKTWLQIQAPLCDLG